MKRIISVLFFLTIIFCTPLIIKAAETLYTASVEGEIPLYIEPSTESYEVIKVPACSVATVLEKSGTWCLVVCENKTGWINMSYTRTGYKQAAEVSGLDSKRLIEVSSESGSTLLRKTPYDTEIQAEGEQFVPNGTVLEISRETANGWGLVTIKDSYMWIKLGETKDYIKSVDVDKYELRTVYVLSPDGKGITMWEDATENKACAVIPDCTGLIVREESEGHVYVTYGGKNGWINSEYTVSSLFNAQIQAGEEVKKSYKIDSSAYGNEVDLLSVPSYKDEAGGRVLCSVKSNSIVYVLRKVKGDWYLVQHKEFLGWLPPGSLIEESVEEGDKNIVVYEEPKEGYIATSKGKGLKLFAKASGGGTLAYLPETAYVKVLAEKDDYKYVICDYASGWTTGVELKGSMEDAMKISIDNDCGEYELRHPATIMSMPTNEKALGSREICKAEKGKVLKILRFVYTADERWALVEYEGNMGWINISVDNKMDFTAVMLLVTGSVLLLILIAVFVIIRKKRAKKSVVEANKKIEEEKTKEVEDDEKDIPDGDSRPQEESADVSGE